MAEAVGRQLEDLDLSAALETVWGFVRRLNRYVEEQAPWKQAKEAAAEAAAVAEEHPGGAAAAAPVGAPGEAGSVAGGAAAALDSTLWDLAEGLRLLSVVLHPFIPATARALCERLGLEEAAAGGPEEGAEAGPSWKEARWGLLPAGLSVVTGPPLFPRIEE